MITNLDRSGWFGASDTHRIMNPNHTTNTWINWWDVKLGKVDSDTGRNIYTITGTVYEHPIIESIDEGIICDGQILIEDLLLRVNYDGWKDGTIYEVKTHSAKKDFKVTKEYWEQCQVEMYVYQEMQEKWFLPDFKKLYIVSYALVDSDYESARAGYADEIDLSRRNMEEIRYDKDWIKGKYLPTLKPLTRSLRKGIKKLQQETP